MEEKKSAKILRNIARDFYCMEIGDNVKTIANYAKHFSSSRGLIQIALDTLVNSGAIVISKKGVLGTFINKINYDKLLPFTGWDLIIGSGPLPYTKKHEGISTAIYMSFNKTSMPFYLSYMQGARNRAKALKEGKSNFAFMSKKSAIELKEEFNELEILFELDDYSYISGINAIYKDPTYINKKHIVVGVDSNSPDHFELSKKIFNNESIEFKQMHYTRLLIAVFKGEVDVILFNSDVIKQGLIKDKIEETDLYITNIDLDGDFLGDTIAAFIYNKNDYKMDTLLRKILCIDNLIENRDKLIKGEIFPIF